MHHQFNIQQLYALPTLYLCVLYLSENKTATCATYSINWLVFYNRDEKCLLRGRDWVFNYSSLRFVFERLRLFTPLYLKHLTVVHIFHFSGIIVHVAEF